MFCLMVTSCFVERAGGIIHTLASPLQLKLHLPSLMQWLLGASFRESDPVTHCLASTAFRNFDASLHDTLSIASFVAAKPVPCGWCS